MRKWMNGTRSQRLRETRGHPASGHHGDQMESATHHEPFPGRRLAPALLLAAFAGACATMADPSRLEVALPPRPGVTARFDRVLVAGFIAGFVSDRGGRLDLNEETARLVRTALGATSVRVLDAEPLRLDSTRARGLSPANLVLAPASGAAVPARGAGDPVFTNTAFWKRLGEEYGAPLILTGSIVFSPAAPRYEGRPAGRGTLRVWRRGFILSGTLMLISGRTGEIIDSMTLRPLTAHAATGRDSALSLYFGLMDRAMPSILTLFGQRSAHERVLLR